MNDIRFEEFSEEYFRRSIVWLADDEIRKLTMAPPIKESERRKWFLGLPERKDYLVEGVSCNGISIGVVGLKHIDSKREMKAEYFGYIGEKEYWGKGIGKKMLEHMSEVSISMGLKSLVLEVADFNERAKRLYVQQGFEINDRDEDRLIMLKRL